MISTGCPPDLEHLMIRCRPYYLPREFTLVIMTAVYVPPHADTNKAMDKLYGVINRTETSWLEAAFIVLRDFNNANLSKVLPRYHQNISCSMRGQLEDAIALTLHTALSHLDQRDTYYVRMLFIDYSSAFNTIVPSKLVTKLRDLGLNSALCDWILNFLTGRPQAVRMGSTTSSTLTLNTGAPGLLITSDDQRAYREEFRAPTSWRQDNHGGCQRPQNKGADGGFQEEAETGTCPPFHQWVSSFRFLRVHISEDLTWTHHTDFDTKSARQQLFFLRRLWRLNMNSRIFCNFYRCTIESILTGCITAWYSSCTNPQP
ncbi:hypothetical protein L3Q82_000406 [Scortum barcoo]|uniref:Uncharacterized protein n=1 Tax=Scortum barcoo TaxID=214431 RepID=A0ACB8XA50_9TELE|nr:hypothetical protein L3Q82_000406 [Scortum barcoo]